MAAQFSLIAKLTNTALQRTAQNATNGGSFIVENFVIGNAGHDPSNTALAFAPDPTIGDICTGADCPGVAIAAKAISEVVFPEPKCPVFKCELSLGEYVGEFSQLLLLARVTTSGAADEGQYFVFAVANSPLKNVTITDAAVLQVGVQY